MKNYIEKISEALYDLDIEGLAEIGCPEDEYDSEARMIYERANKNMTVVEVSEICRDVFDEMFYQYHSSEDFIHIAEKILKEIF